MIRSMRALLAVALISLSGCSVRTYFSDRGRDLADIATITTGTGFGLRAQVGPLAVAPVIMQSDAMGLRGGEFFRVGSVDENLLHPPVDGGALWWASSTFYLEDSLRLEDRGKAVVALPVPESDRDMSFTVFSGNVPFVCVPRTNWKAENVVIQRYPAHYWTQIEVVAALMGSLRVGVNPGELVDFVLGWLPYVDLYGDDLGRRLRVVPTPQIPGQAVEEPAPPPRAKTPSAAEPATARHPAPDGRSHWWQGFTTGIGTFLFGKVPPLEPMTPEEIEEAKRRPETREEAARRKEVEEDGLQLRRSYSPPGNLGF